MPPLFIFSGGEVMDVEVRSLKTNDVFAASKILKKMGIKFDVTTKNAEGVTVFKTQQQLGAEFFLQIGENLHLAQTEINAFLGSLVGKTADEFGELDLIDEALPIIQKLKENPKLANFFKLAGQFAK